MDQVWLMSLHEASCGSSEKSDFEQEDDDFVAESSGTSIAAPVVVFAPGTQSEDKPQVDKAAMRAFMVRPSAAFICRPPNFLKSVFKNLEIAQRPRIFGVQQAKGKRFR